MIGVVGTALGTAGVNIADMDVGRMDTPGSAIMVLATTTSTPPDVIAALRGTPGIISVHPLESGDNGNR
jgi:D-3-phosphoglycerate dehydrogenase